MENDAANTINTIPIKYLTGDGRQESDIQGLKL